MYGRGLGIMYGVCRGSLCMGRAVMKPLASYVLDLILKLVIKLYTVRGSMCSGGLG